MDLGCSWFRTLFRVGSGLLCFIESWFIVFPKGWLEGLSKISLKLYLRWLACLLAGWLAGSLAYFLACFLNCLLAAFLACLLAAKLLLALPTTGVVQCSCSYRLGVVAGVVVGVV